ncbi:hypothetical protein [Rummeliibacillus pycnus]|uniref:hypothetical protein n=1 Tax=Rummeliibacillus pycnus TaxID=101070 RepID=UPI001475DF43|nr:hypothetical protein [Rummeliibacillus pycnus]
MTKIQIFDYIACSKKRAANYIIVLQNAQLYKSSKTVELSTVFSFMKNNIDQRKWNVDRL